MEKQKATPEIEQETTPKSQHVIVHKNNNVPLVGAIVLLSIVIAAAAISFSMQSKNKEVAIIPSPSPSVAPTIPTTAPTVTNETTSWQKITVKKMKNLSFPGFTINHPQDWIAKETRDEIKTTLTLNKGVYMIEIEQGPMGGNQCIFEGEMPDGPATDYRNIESVDLKASKIAFKRILTASGAGGKTAYSLCSDSPSSKGTFGTPTYFGIITLSAFSQQDSTLTEMDKIISTLKAL